MREKLLEKIDREYQLFYLNMTATSKSNLFAKSAEIEYRKRMFSYLRGFVEEQPPERIRKLLVIDNLLDECCRYSEDCPGESEEKSVKKFMAGI